MFNSFMAKVPIIQKPVWFLYERDLCHEGITCLSVNHHKGKVEEKEHNNKVKVVITTFIINPFQATLLFLYSLKTSQNLRFSAVFRGYKKGAVAWNGLNGMHEKELSKDHKVTVSCLSSSTSKTILENYVWCAEAVVRWSVKKVFLKISLNWEENNTCARVSCLMRLQTYGLKVPAFQSKY